MTDSRKCEICSSTFNVKQEKFFSENISLCRYCSYIANTHKIRNKFDAIVLSKILLRVIE